MTPENIENTLKEIFSEAIEDGVFGNVRSFEEAMILTRDRGLVVKTVFGDEFQITIVQSQFGTTNEEDEP